MHRLANRTGRPRGGAARNDISRRDDLGRRRPMASVVAGKDHMYSKFLFVGLGGSGGKTLRFLKREIGRWMEAHGVGARIPNAWQFLHIDTPTVPDGQEINDIAPPLEDDEYMGLINAGLSFKALQHMLDGDHYLRDELRSWRVEPAGLGVSVDQGAGQFRAVGQTVAMAFSSQIREKLEERVRRMTGPGAQSELGELYDAVEASRNGHAGPDANMYIVVVSSLAGGTGAGLLNLVCDLLRAMETPAGDRIFALLYTPEVFQSLGGAVTGGVYPNSLAAICEMLNGQWWQGSDVSAPSIAAPKQNAVLSRAGLPKPQERSGPTYPFLVGRVAEGGVDHGTPDRLFEMTGRSLLSWVTDLVVQSRFVAYTSGNWAATALAHEQGPILVNAGETHEQGLPCLSALGFSRLSVGGDHFERYAQQRLVKDALAHLARYHTDSGEAVAVARNLETEDPDAILRKIAEDHRPAFLHETRLAEVGPDDNEIIDDLRPARHEELYGEFLRQVRQNSGVDHYDKLDVEEWRRHISDAIVEARRTYEVEYRRDLELSTDEWIEAVRERVTEAVERRIGLHGLLVAAELCSQTSRYLTEEVAVDLTDNDVEQNKRYAAQASDVVNEALETAGRAVPSDDARLEEAISQGVSAAAYAGDALLCGQAAVLAAQVADRILTPLSRALRDAHDVAEADARRTVSWVNWDDEPPPIDVRPPTGDFSLIDPDNYPRYFSDLVGRDVGDAIHLLEQREQVRRDIISGSFLERTATAASGTVSSCMTVEQDWFPEQGAARSRPPADLRVSLSTRLDDLTDRAHAWLRRPGSAWDNFLGRSIRDFVGTTDAFDAKAISEAEARRNRSRFINQLNAALAAAAPLINIDESLLGLVHPNTDRSGPRLQLSSMPLAAHPIEEELRSALSRAGINDDEIGRALTSDSSVDHIDITSALGAPISVLAVESLLRPISERWFQLNSVGQRNAFWARRRAQPLESFIPAPQALIRCMVRGWFTGRLLGLVRPVDGSWAVWIPRDERCVSFSREWLSAPRASRDQDSLALVLESLALAYVEVSRNGTLQPLLPYIELRELGRSKPEGGLLGYESLSPVLDRWVTDGLIDAEAGDAAVLISERISDGDSTPAERLSRLAAVCREVISGYEQLYSESQAQWRSQPALLSTAPHWTGLWECHMSPALNDIAQAAERQAQQLADGTGPLM